MESHADRLLENPLSNGGLDLARRLEAYAGNAREYVARKWECGACRGVLVLGLVVFAGVCGVWGNAAAADEKPLKVFLLVGQSNMQGQAHVRTFEHVGMDRKTAPILREIQNTDGTPRVCENVWISYLSSSGEQHGRLTAGFGADRNKIGPELTFGIYMQKALGEPILIIKTAWGGKSLHTDFRPPSAGAYEFGEAQLESFRKQGKDIDAIKAAKVKATGHYYRLMLEHVRSVLADVSRVYPAYDSKSGFCEDHDPDRQGICRGHDADGSSAVMMAHESFHAAVHGIGRERLHEYPPAISGMRAGV